MEEGLSTPYSPREEPGGREDPGMGTHSCVPRSRAGGSVVRRVDDAWGAGKPGNLQGWETGDPSSQETLVQHPFIAGNLRQSTHGPFLPSAGED